MRHLKELKRRLVRVNQVITLERVLAELETEATFAQECYLNAIRPVLDCCAAAYRQKEVTQAAYYAYFLNRRRGGTISVGDGLMTVLLDYLKRDSLYCRVNAMNVLYAYGDAACVFQAVCELDRLDGFPHGKLLTEGLLSFQGDHEKLIALFFRSLGGFSELTQVAVLNYIRFQSGERCAEMLALMTDENKGKEIRPAAIRYFGKYHYPPARDILLQFLQDPTELCWENAAVSATSLAGYQGEEVTKALLNSLNSPNWHIRSNAASSLNDHSLSYEQLRHIMTGKDRYAREMMLYAMEARQLQREERVEV